MINGAHVILYSRDAEADRAFIRDVLGFPGVDAGHGWLIFKLPPAELAAHPTDGPPHHEFYLMCDDIQATVDELVGKGVHVDKPISDQGWGLLTAIKLPSGGELPIYQPRHPLAKDL
jgi:catechol 2,3-dioxygenase-like lactoylglutathione lyase family enzyme